MHNRTFTLITGASQGFGKALALEFASRKMNLILVALPGKELFYLSRLIEINYGVKVIFIEKDLCAEGSAKDVFDTVKRMGLKVNILVNNAGLGSTLYFEEGSDRLYEAQIRLNVLATTMLTRSFVGMLKENSPSYILNVGSLSSYFNIPKKHVYAATKSFVYSFSKSLANELRHKQVHVSVVCPGGMNTNQQIILQNRSGCWITRQSILEPERAAKLTVDGLFAGKKVIIPGTLNRGFMLMGKIIPGSIKNLIMQNEMVRLTAASVSGKPVVQIHLPALTK